MDSLGIFSRGGNGSRKESLLFFLLGRVEAQGSFPAKIQGGVVSTRLGIAPVYFFPQNGKAVWEANFTVGRKIAASLFYYSYKSNIVGLVSNSFSSIY